METEEMIEILEGQIRAPETNPTAKCTAIRTLMRIEDDAGRRPKDADEWDDELERLLHDDD